MGRPSGADENLALISRIRSRLPDAFLRSSFLVGFFGETGDALQELIEFQDRAEIDWLGVFAYSREDSTPADRFRDRPVSAEEALRRKELIQERQIPITHSRVERLVGKELDVLVEEMVEHEALALGRCYAQAPEVDGATVIRVPESRRQRIAPGRLIRCRIVRRNGLDVEAAPL
jgi:ribosomal protein S12 methylthiotransferase